MPNGPAFAPGGDWLYHSDTARRTVYRFALDADGALAEKCPFIHFAEADGCPDNHLWIAHWGGGRISRFAPEGTLDRAIALPARQITNIAFAGAGLDRMFVTSATIGLAPG